MSTLTIISQALAYDDEGATSNPRQKPVDWKRTVSNLPVENPQTQRRTLEPQGSFSFWDGTRSTTVDGTTEFDLTINPTNPSRYRLTHVGETTAPGFRQYRAVVAEGASLNFTVNANLTVTVQTDASDAFADVLGGDILFVPGVATGDASNSVNPLNVGYWTVLTKVSSQQLIVSRPAGQIFEGVNDEAIAPAGVFVFSSTGVQVGDTVDLNGGFASGTLRSYEIVGVTHEWIEILSTVPLAEERDVTPGSLPIYTSAKRFVSIEVDQESSIRLNGDENDFNKVAPWVAGNKAFVGEFRITGPVWRLDVVNRTSVPANVLVLSAE